MAVNTYKKNTFKKKEHSKKSSAQEKTSVKRSIFKDKRWGLSFGILFMMFAVFLFLAFLSYLFSGQADQSVIVGETGEPIRNQAVEAQNWLGYSGALMAHYFIYRWFGLAALLFPPFLFLIGFRLSFKRDLVSLTRYSAFSLFFLFLLGLLMVYFVHLMEDYNYLGFLSGGFGYELALLSDEFLGWGTFILIFGSLLIFVIFFFNIDSINWFTADEKQHQEARESHHPYLHKQ
jgi:S-DNA-T family DNA segregation ATPase FtsK/SpoIIIE